MIPILFPADYTSASFSNHGIGNLVDAIDCRTHVEVNGLWTLTLKYPMTGRYYEQIAVGSIVKAAIYPNHAERAFRIYRRTKPINGVVTYYARCLAYDLTGIVIKPFSAESLTDALAAIGTNATSTFNFTISSNFTSTQAFAISEPMSAWDVLREIVAQYGGEVMFQNWNVSLRNRLGSTTEITIRYAKNMTDLEQDENSDGLFTGVFPFWQDDDGNYVEGVVKRAVTTFPVEKIMPLDLSDMFETQPSAGDLNQEAALYVSNVGFGELMPSLKVNAVVDTINLGDTVTIVHERLGITATARAVSIDANTLNEQYVSITFGQVQRNIADTIAGQAMDSLGAARQIVNAAIETDTKTYTYNGLTVTARRSAHCVNLTITGSTTAEMATGAGYVVLGTLDASFRPGVNLIRYAFFNGSVYCQLNVYTNGTMQLGYAKNITDGTPINLPAGSPSRLNIEFITG